jgi:hypothetical protein
MSGRNDALRRYRAKRKPKAGFARSAGIALFDTLQCRKPCRAQVEQLQSLTAPNSASTSNRTAPQWQESV